MNQQQIEKLLFWASAVIVVAAFIYIIFCIPYSKETNVMTNYGTSTVSNIINALNPIAVLIISIALFLGLVVWVTWGLADLGLKEHYENWRRKK